MRPASILEKSNRLLTSLKRRRQLRRARSRWSRTAAGVWAFILASSRGPNINVSGVRNSWLMLEKKVVLARSISASASARLRSASYAHAFATAVATCDARRSRKARYSVLRGIRELTPSTNAPAGWCAKFDLIGTTTAVAGARSATICGDSVRTARAKGQGDRAASHSRSNVSALKGLGGAPALQT